MIMPGHIGLMAAGGPPPVVYDADYQAVLTYAIAQGYVLPSAGIRAAGNQLVVGLKSQGIWALLDELYIHAGAGDGDFALMNWKNPALSAYRINAPTWSYANGYVGTGTSYLRSNAPLDASGAWQQTNASIFAWFPTLAPSSTQDILSTGGYARMWWRSTNPPGWRAFLNDNTNVGHGNFPDAGLHLVTRTASNSISHYVNGQLALTFGRNATALDGGYLSWAKLNPVAILGRGANLAGVQDLLYAELNAYLTAL